jgi:hypothetical protein
MTSAELAAYNNGITAARGLVEAALAHQDSLHIHPLRRELAKEICLAIIQGCEELRLTGEPREPAAEESAA